ncbi:MAG TPA: peptidyl-prolyl cis-trans isomerase [Opitutaceae bacterium]|nr:peptidyl-prolyl cis-trans isomerase [Opitutaceae bacterium]
MISWIQRYFQRHFKTIFAVLLAVTIISFIFTIGAMPGLGSGERQSAKSQEFFGYNLASGEDYQRLMGDATLSANLQLGTMGGIDDNQLKQYAFQRGATLYLADKWHIPPATTAEVRDAIMKLRMFAGQNGEFDPKAYATFRDNLKMSPGGATEADIARVIGDDVRAEKVDKLLAGPGYVLDRDVRSQLERTDTTWTLKTATADYAAFKPSIKPTDAELTKYFEDNSFRYEIPPRVVVSYADFPTSDYLPKVQVTDAQVRAYYDANPARFPNPKPAADAKKPVKPNPDADFAAVRPQVEAALKLEQAKRLALNAASDLALALYEAKINTAPAFDAFLTERKVPEKTAAPFTKEDGVPEFGHSTEISDAAFKLSQDHPVSDALPAPDGAVVLFWRDTQKAHTPLFTDVRPKVLADFIENERRKQFVELGNRAKGQLTSRLKAGDTFDKAVAATAADTGLKLTVKSIPPFTIRTRPQDVDYSILGSLERLNKGQVSDMIINADRGIFVYAEDKKLPDLSPKNPEYAQTREQLASYGARIGASSYISEMVDRELKRSESKPE